MVVEFLVEFLPHSLPAVWTATLYLLLSTVHEDHAKADMYRFMAACVLVIH